MKEEWRLNVLERYEKRYGEIWEGVKTGIHGDSDAFWLIGASSYVFSAGGAKWAVDPMFNTPRSGMSRERIDTDAVFHALDFALLTHRHADHFDPRLMERYAALEWIVPDHMEHEIPAACRERMTVVKPGDVIVRRGVRITAFSSLHYDAGTTVGVEETGYFVEAGPHRLLFPGDVRDYDAARLPAFEKVTHLFMHVWLGRRNALNWPCGDYPDQMAEFALSFGAEKIYLAHLMEAERPLEDLWTYAHAGLVMDALMGRAPGAEVCVPLVGKMNLL